MADEELRLEVSADVSKATSDLNAFITTMGKMRGEGVALDDVIDKFDTRLTKVSKTLRDANTSTGGAATGTGKLAASSAQASQNLPRLRYALYDVSSALAVFGAAATAAAVAPYAIAIAWERSFADVRRTTDGTAAQLDLLESQFINLAQTIPVSFKALSEIGSLAGQLNVPRQEIAEFTELVAKFSATTDVSIDASATAFARLSQLLPPLAGGYEALGSSILQVGINSIATESQIIAISTQIAGIANQAGLSADEVFGLSAALASLGIQPELARGTITRLFGNIGRAVSSGGTALQDFGAVADMTGKQFEAAWSEAPMDALLSFFEGLGNKEGPAAEAALRALGITSVRDVPAILRLSQNVDLLRLNLADSAEGAENATELNRQYGIIAETVAEKITLLSNNFQALLATLGQSATGIGGFIDLLNGLLQRMTDIASDPFWSVVATGVLGLSLLAGVLALAGAAMVRTAASVLALRTAMTELNISTLRGNAGLASAIPLILGTGRAATGAAVGVRTLTTAVKALSVAGVALLGVELAGGISDWARDWRGGTVDVDHLSDAMSKGAISAQDFEAALGSIGRSNALLPSVLWDETQAMDEGLRALGDSTLSYFNNSFTGLTGWVVDTFSGTKAAIGEYQQALIDAYNAGNIVEAVDEYRRLNEAVLAAGGSQQAFNENFAEFIDLLDPAAYGAALADQQAEAANALTEEYALLVEQIDGLISAHTEEVDATLRSQDAIYSLGESLRENGASFDEFSAGGRANMQALLQAVNAIAAQTPGDAAAIANNLNALFRSIVEGGYASANQMNVLRNIISSLGGVTGSATIPMVELGNGFQAAAVKATRTAKAAREVRKEVVTLKDYASDLAGVMSRAFEIRFSSQTAMDQVTSRWIDLNEEMAEYRRKVRELTADRKVTKYFLSIAEAYGDTLRAGVLRSDLADIDAELAEAQAGVSTELKGNSKAAIENRATITGLVKGYQDYITELAASGASQAELNQAVQRSQREFEAQATALGYSTKQLQPYIKSFRDMKVVIDNVPRNITVNANTDPALQALAEFEAALKKLSGKSYPGPTISNPTDAKAIRRMALEAEIAARADWISQLRRSGNYSGAIQASDSIARMREQLRTGSFKEGGYTGSGGTSAPAGIVHGKEFVFTAEATRNAGVGNLYGMMRAFEQGRGYQGGGYVAARATASSTGPNVFILDQAQYQGLINSGKVVVQLGSEQIANAVNNANQQYANLGRS